MSVAFRRDSDEEHLEPKFERPIPPGPNLVTVLGLALIEQQISTLESDLLSARDEAAKAALKRDLRYWQTRRITAQVAPTPLGDKVEFGTEVSVLLNGKLRTFRIVGDDEADPAASLISFKAPLCQAMLCAQVGEILPLGQIAEAIEIVRIEIPAESFLDGLA